MVRGTVRGNVGTAGYVGWKELFSTSENKFQIICNEWTCNYTYIHLKFHTYNVICYIVEYEGVLYTSLQYIVEHEGVFVLLCTSLH